MSRLVLQMLVCRQGGRAWTPQGSRPGVVPEALPTAPGSVSPSLCDSTAFSPSSHVGCQPQPVGCLVFAELRTLRGQSSLFAAALVLVTGQTD